MSLLRACQRATLKGALRRPLLASASRGITAVPSGTPEIAKDASDITPQVPRDVMVADVISGAPRELRYRTVRVYQPTRNTMQSGGAKSNRWRIDFDILLGGGRWENPVMGWASSADYMQGTRLSFRTKEDAIHFAEKQGWDYYVQPPTTKRVPAKNYSENYMYKPNKLRIARTK